MPQLTISHLDGPQIEAAFPLVWIAAPDLDRRRWARHCDHAIRLGGGVLGAATVDGPLLGVAAYRPDRDLRRGLILRVDPLVAFELADADAVRGALCEAIALLGHGLGCEGMILAVPGRGYSHGGSDKTGKWLRLGLAPDAVTFARLLQPESPRSRTGRTELAQNDC